MKVYLINPDYMLYANPPLGLAYLASYVRQEMPEVEIKILDQISYKKIIKIIKKEKPDVVGITSVSENWFKVKELAREIKKTGDVRRLIVGGIHITTQPECFNKSSFDYGVRGEGEISFVELLKLIKEDKEKITDLRKIIGLLIKKENKVINTGISKRIEDLEILPLPALDLLNMKYYSLPSFSKSTFLLLTSRGCPYNCKFCSSSHFWENKIKFFSAKKVVDEIEILYRRYGFTLICIGDDLFAINKMRIKEIIKILKEKNLLGKIEFHCGGRANSFDEEMATLLKELGVTTVGFGFESGSEKTLNYLKGGNVTVKDNERAINICKKYNLNILGLFMIGSPYETLDNINKTYLFIKKYCKDNFNIYQTIAYPGTEIWSYAIKNNIIPKSLYETKTREFIDLESNYLFTKEVSKENFTKIYEKIKSIHSKNRRLELFHILKAINIKNLQGFFSMMFLKKVWNLRKRFLKRMK